MQIFITENFVWSIENRIPTEFGLHYKVLIAHFLNNKYEFLLKSVFISISKCEYSHKVLSFIYISFLCRPTLFLDLYLSLKMIFPSRLSIVGAPK